MSKVTGVSASELISKTRARHTKRQDTHHLEQGKGGKSVEYSLNVF
ncbi:MAG: hypothetical protein HWE27_05630 [Gammaproteobacteria bacterium]|nr:hypothetical protein [Gammaproteobacteria bacterium]